MEDEYYFQKIYPLKIYDHLDQQKQKNNKNNTNNHRYAKQLIEIDLNEQKEIQLNYIVSIPIENPLKNINNRMFLSLNMFLFSKKPQEYWNRRGTKIVLNI